MRSLTAATSASVADGDAHAHERSTALLLLGPALVVVVTVSVLLGEGREVPVPAVALGVVMAANLVAPLPTLLTGALATAAATLCVVVEDPFGPTGDALRVALVACVSAASVWASALRTRRERRERVVAARLAVTTAELTASERTRQLTVLAADLVDATTPEEVAGVVVRSVQRLTGARAVVLVATGESPRRHTAATERVADRLDHLGTAPDVERLLAPGGPVAGALAAGTVASVELDHETLFGIPLVAGRTIGAIGVLLPAGAAGPYLTRMLHAVADTAAASMDRAALYREARQRLGRLEQLQDFTAALARAVTPEDVVTAVQEWGFVAARACGGGLALRQTESGDALRLATWRGLLPETSEQWQVVPLDASNPLGAATIRGASQFYGTRDALIAEFPDALPVAVPEHRAWAALLLQVGNEMLGTLGLIWDDEQDFAEAQRHELQAFSDLVAQALARTMHDADRRRALTELERNQARLSALHGLVTRLSMAVTVDEVAEVIARNTLPPLVGGARVLLLDEDDPTLLVQLGTPAPADDTPRRRVALADRLPPSDVFNRGRPLVLADPAAIAGAYPDLAPFAETAGMQAWAGFPLAAGGRVLGVLALRFRSPQRLDEADLQFFSSVAEQSLQAIDRARLHERDRGLAETLQRSLLPRGVPSVPGMRFDAVYLPGSVEAEVGGDWYDVLLLRDDRVALVIGDVAGRGAQAATVMGQLRSASRAVFQAAESPAEALEALNRFVVELGDAEMVTAFAAVVSVDDGTVQYASAGHPPGLVVSHDGSTCWLDAAPSPPLGVGPTLGAHATTVAVEPLSALVLYTDGLVERRKEAIDEGLARLAGVAGRAARDPEPARVLADALLGGRPRGDDVAVLVAALVPVGPTFELDVPAAPGSLGVVRRHVRHWLRGQGANDDLVTDLVLAFSEAVANAVEHAFAPTGATVHVEGRVEGHDEGAEPPTVVLGVRDDGNWRERPSRDGRGLEIMAKLATVAVQRGPSGTTVELRRGLRETL